MNARLLLGTGVTAAAVCAAGILVSTNAIRETLAALQVRREPVQPVAAPLPEPRVAPLDRLVEVLREDREALRNELADLRRRLDAAPSADPVSPVVTEPSPVPESKLVPESEVQAPVTVAEARIGLQRYLAREASERGYRLVPFAQRTPDVAARLRLARQAGGHQPFYYPRNTAAPSLYVDLYVDVAGRTIFYRPQAAADLAVAESR